MKLLKPHSKCCILSSANYTEEVWRHFLNTVVCQSFPPPPPPQSLRITPSHPRPVSRMKMKCPSPAVPAVLRITPPPHVLCQILKGVWASDQLVWCLSDSVGRRPRPSVTLLFPVLLTATVSPAHTLVSPTNPSGVKDSYSSRLTSCLPSSNCDLHGVL